VFIVGDRLRAIREEKRLSQGDIEKRTGLLRCYISRVENGHTVPAIETLEKLARALEIPLYQFFYEDVESPKLAEKARENPSDELWGRSGKEARLLIKLRHHLSRIDEDYRGLLLLMARHMQKAAPRQAVKNPS
jgi:transcriptional regulator with XRE-family HTH domain